MDSISALGAAAVPLLFNIIAAIIIYIIGKKLISLALKGVDKATAKAGTDETLRKFFLSVVKIGLYVLLVFIIVSQLGVNTASLITVLGSAALAVGLALQGSLANFAGGVLILLTRPFQVGDYIVTGLGEGVVEEINLICTKLTTLDKKVIIIPNSAISGAPITNCSTHPTRRVDIAVPISYRFPRAGHITSTTRTPAIRTMDTTRGRGRRGTRRCRTTTRSCWRARSRTRFASTGRSWCQTTW